MQTDELKRAQNREKQRIWREKNLERSRELKRVANWKVRGMPKPRVYLEKTEKPLKKVKLPKPIKEKKVRKSPSIHESGFVEDKLPAIDVSLCMSCYRKYLSKYHCMWCNGEIKEIYGTRANYSYQS